MLDEHAREIESINLIVRTIVDEDALQTAAVASELNRLYAVGEKLVRCLKELDAGDKGKARRLAHQLVHGTNDEQTLADIMAELDRTKASLSLRVQLANVGLTRMVRDTLFVNVEVVNRIDHLLAGLSDENHGLRLTGLLNEAMSQGPCNGALSYFWR